MDFRVIEKQEQLLRFDSFNYDMAIEIGLMILEEGRKKGKPIAIDISKCGQQIFHVALEGTSPDNDEWIKKKKNSVYRFYGSTLGMQARLKEFNVSMEAAMHISSQEYTESGGGFPIYVTNVGFIGAIVVSGLPDVEDHELITTCLSRYLKVDNCPTVLN